MKIVIIIISFLVIGSIGIYIFLPREMPEILSENQPILSELSISPTSTPQSNGSTEMQTYRNEEWGFEFQYPEDWEVRESSYGSPSGKLKLDFKFPNMKYPSDLSIYIVKPEWLNLISNRATSDVMVNGVKGTKYGVDTNADIHGIYITFPLKEYNLILRSGEHYEDVFSKVISTFKFFSASGAPQRTIEPKTYINKEWGFEFQYPGDWTIKENYFGSPVSKFNLEVVPVVGGTSFPDPVFINIVTADFGDHAFQYLNSIFLEVRVDGVWGKRYDYESEGMQRVSILLPLDDFRIILGMEQRYRNIFDQILSTFKFLK